MTDLQALSAQACLAMNLVADLPHKASESVLYPKLAEDDGLAVTHCLPWLRARCRGSLAFALEPRHSSKWKAWRKYTRQSAAGATLAIALCRLVVKVHEAEQTK